MADDDRPRRHLNAGQKRALQSAGIARFVADQGRTSRRGGLDPNDRTHDDKLARKVRQLPPAELDRLLREDED